MQRGYIKLWRRIDENPLYFAEPFTKIQAFLDLVMLARHMDGDVYVRGINVKIKRGQVMAGEQFLADRWQWSRNKVRRYMDYLSSKTIQQIQVSKSNVVTIVTINNYDTYQENDTPNDTTERQQKDIPKNKRYIDKKDNLYKYNGSIKSIIDDLNKVIGTKYKHTTRAYIKLINARLNEDFTVEDFFAVHRKMNSKWSNTDMATYLRPETLYSSKFQSYLNAKGTCPKCGGKGEYIQRGTHGTSTVKCDCRR